MASSCESGVAMMTVCQTCGDKGDYHLLIYCLKCHDSAVHHYCLDKFSLDDDEINWMCEECALKDAKVRSSRKSERIILREDRAFEVRINWKKRLNKKSSSMAKILVYSDRMAETAQISGDPSRTGEEMKNRHPFDETCGNQVLRKQRRLMLGDRGSSKEQSDSVKVKASPLAPYGHYVPLNIPHCQPSLEPNNFVYAQPVAYPIWRGSFSITNEKGEILVGIMAHLSCKACPKVSNVAAALPLVLDIEILARGDAWPVSFQRSPPTDDNIALYLFPECERDEQVFDCLLENMNENKLAWKAMIDDVDLLIFSSLELPRQHWRFRRKYYLWGVFRQKQNYLSLVPTDHPVVNNSSVKCVSPSMYVNQAGNRDVKGLAKTTTTWSPRSPLSTGSSHVSNTSQSAFLPKAKSSSAESLSYCSSKHVS